MTEEYGRPVDVIAIGRSVFEVYDGWARTILHDGKTVHAVPHDTDEYRERARDRGYGDDVFALCRDHEFLHSALSVLFGLPESLVMRRVADGTAHDWRSGVEEAMVLDAQAMCNAHGVRPMDALRPLLASLSADIQRG